MSMVTLFGHKFQHSTFCDQEMLPFKYSQVYFISTLGLGEHAFEIKVIQSGTSRDAPCKIVVLGVKSIFVLHHSGVLAYSKKLDFNPVTMLTYPSCNKLPALSDNPMFKREKKVA